MSSERIPTHEGGDFNEDQALPVTQVHEGEMVTHAEFRSTICLMAKVVTALCDQSRSARMDSQRHKEMRRSRAKRARVDGNFQGKSVYVQYPTCKTCGKSHKGTCLAGLNACYKCAKPGHHARECRSGAPTPYRRDNGEVGEVPKEIKTCPNCGKKHKGRCLMGLGVCYKCKQMGHYAKECGRDNGQIRVGLRKQGVEIMEVGESSNTAMGMFMVLALNILLNYVVDLVACTMVELEDLVKGEKDEVYSQGGDCV